LRKPAFAAFMGIIRAAETLIAVRMRVNILRSPWIAERGPVRARGLEAGLLR
jgi:hypothetical protein